MSIDLFSTVQLDAMVRVMPPKASFFKTKFFNVDKPEPTTKIAVDFYKGKRRVAPFVSERNVAPVAEKIGYATNTFDTPLVSVKDVTNIEDLMKRLPGELLMNSGVSPDERALQLLAQTLVDFDDQISRREEVMCAQALFDGKIDVIGEDVNYTVDFEMTNTATLSVLWDATDSTADPVADLKGMAVQCMLKGYRTPDICIMERSAYAAFVNRCKELGYFNQWNFLDVSIQPERNDLENVTYCGRLRDPGVDIYIYDAWYIDDWSSDTPTEKSMVPKGKVLLASTRAKYSTYYGVMTFTDPMTNAFRSIMGTRGADSWIQKEPAMRFLKLASRPLPVPHEIDSWYVATVSETE